MTGSRPASIASEKRCRSMIAVGGDVFLELAVIGRDFVAPVVVERAAQAADDAIGVALELLVAQADVEQVARDDEAEAAVVDRARCRPRCGPRVGRRVPAAGRPAGLVLQPEARIALASVVRSAGLRNGLSSRGALAEVELCRRCPG